VDRRRRLEKSRQNLADPLHLGASIAQTALSCGFADFGHFSRRYEKPSLRRFTT
jgi:AraC-like DNA-binding protein